jgi:UDP-N-acetylglucosamine acyltransferase
MPQNIHATAIIAPDAKIGDNATIGPYTIIGKKTTIGAGSRIGPHCVIENTIMGENNEVISCASIGLKPQDLSYDGIESMVVIGSNNQIREGVTIHRATSLDAPTVIGDNCLFMANSHVAHDCRIGDNVILVNSSGVAGHVDIANNAILSGMSAVHQFVRIGRLAMISGLSGLPLDVPPFCRASGGRAKLVGLNTIGLRRNGFTREMISAVKNAYKTLFHSTRTLKESIEILRKNNPTPEVLEMIVFIENTKRGVTAARRKQNLKENGDDE